MSSGESVDSAGGSDDSVGDGLGVSEAETSPEVGLGSLPSAQPARASTAATPTVNALLRMRFEDMSTTLVGVRSRRIDPTPRSLDLGCRYARSF